MMFCAAVRVRLKQSVGSGLIRHSFPLSAASLYPRQNQWVIVAVVQVIDFVGGELLLGREVERHLSVSTCSMKPPLACQGWNFGPR